MNVLPSNTEAEAHDLLVKVSEILVKEGYLRIKGRPLLSTFGGHTAAFGGWGWQGWLDRLKAMIDEEVS